MASSSFFFLRRRLAGKRPPFPPPAAQSRRHHPNTTTARRPMSTAPLPESTDPPKPPNLSARLSFVFDQIDAIDRDRSAKDAALHRICAWRQSHPPPPPLQPPSSPAPSPGEVGSLAQDSKREELDVFKKEVEVSHPWPEWIELMERLAQQNYFDHRRVDEDRVAQNVPLDLSGIRDETGFDFSRDWTTVRTACMNFGRDRFDILRSLSRKDIQILVGHGCPSMDSKVVFSAKLLRKYVHLDEGDVCSSCSLRNSCSRGYILTHKEDEARTLDVMRILLTFGFDHVNGSVENKPLMKLKPVKTIVRKLLHEVVKLSAVPIDPNLPPPVIKKPPPKIKQPPPPPKKRVGRDDVEMKKGDWLCTKCDFMNFAKNTVCLQCDAKRPKRQLLPGEWECPQCNFLNYRRNMACFHCEHKRPADEYTENEMQAKQSGPRTRFERATRKADVPNAWNFDFDDNESDGADVAAFEFADTPKVGEDSSLDRMAHGGVARGFEEDTGDTYKMPKAREKGRYFSEPDERKSTLHTHRTGFDDFDDEEDDDVDSYEIDVSNNNEGRQVHRKNFSEVEMTSESEDFNDFDKHTNSNQSVKDSLYGSEDDDLVDNPRLKSSHTADPWQNAESRGGRYPHREMPFDSDVDIAMNSDSDDEIDEGLKSRQGKRGSQSLGRKGIGQEINLDAHDMDFMESDDDGYLSSNGTKMIGNKGVSGNRRVSENRNLDRSGAARSREFRSDERTSNRRNSFGNSVDDLSSRGSHRYDRGSRGEWRENDKFQGFDGLHNEAESGFRQRERTNQFNDRSRGSQRNERGSGNDDYGGGRRRTGGYGRGRRDDGLHNEAESGFRQRERTNQFNDRSRGSQKNERGSGNDDYGGGRRRTGGYGRGRRDDGLHNEAESGFRQWGRTNQFNDRSRGSQRNERGPRNDGYGGGRRRTDGYGGGRRNDGFGQREGSDYRQHGRINRPADRSRSFDDSSDIDRLSRRIIER